MRDAQMLWDFLVVDSGPASVDTLVVLGSHDIRVADRAADLYLSHEEGQRIIVAGGFGKITKDVWHRSEADVFCDQLKRRGVPLGDILIERESNSINANFTLSRLLAVEAGWDVRKGALVCKPYASRRALAASELAWPEVEWRARPPLVDFDHCPTGLVPLRKLVSLMVGNVQRMEVYAYAGTQRYVEIPAEVRAAQKRLVARGYTEYLLG